MTASSPESTRVAFIGLGVMGFPMAGYLANAGYQTAVYNRTGAKAEAWTQKYKGQTAATPRAAAEGADLVFACVGNDDDVREICVGEHGALDGMKKGAVFVDHTTASAIVARDMDAAATERGLHFLDAPVSGGQAGAENGALTVMVGGDAAVFDRAQPAIDSFARAVTLMGPAGCGQLTKMVNQICIAGVLQGLSEGLDFASRAGLDAKRVLDVISKGAAQSWQMENRGTTMVDDKFDFGFAVDWMRKDLGICLQEGRGNGAHLPMTAVVDQFYGDLQERGHGRWDTSSLIALLRKP